MACWAPLVISTSPAVTSAPRARQPIGHEFPQPFGTFRPAILQRRGAGLAQRPQKRPGQRPAWKLRFVRQPAGQPNHPRIGRRLTL